MNTRTTTTTGPTGTTTTALSHFTETDKISNQFFKHAHLLDLVFAATNRRTRPPRGSRNLQIATLLQLLPWPNAERDAKPQPEAEFVIGLQKQLYEATEDGEKALAPHREGAMFRGYVEGRLGDRLTALWLGIGQFLRYDQFLPGSVGEVEYNVQELRKVCRTSTNWIPARYRDADEPVEESEVKLLLGLTTDLIELGEVLERVHKGEQVFGVAHHRVAHLLVLVEVLASLLKVSLPEQVALHLYALRPAPQH